MGVRGGEGCLGGEGLWGVEGLGGGGWVLGFGSGGEWWRMEDGFEA